MRKMILIPVLGLALAAAQPAFAAETDGAAATPGNWMPISELSAKLTSQGYKVTEIERDDGHYEIEAVNPSGARVEGIAHPVTGEVRWSPDDHD